MYFAFFFFLLPSRKFNQYLFELIVRISMRILVHKHRSLHVGLLHGGYTFIFLCTRSKDNPQFNCVHFQCSAASHRNAALLEAFVTGEIHQSERAYIRDLNTLVKVLLHNSRYHILLRNMYVSCSFFFRRSGGHDFVFTDSISVLHRAAADHRQSADE